MVRHCIDDGFAGDEMSFPLIKKLGLGVVGGAYVNAYSLEEILQKSPVVYGHSSIRLGKAPDSMLWLNYQSDDGDTHQARLICVEEIKPKECEHELDHARYPHRANCFSFSPLIHAMFCIKCGAKIRAKWEAVND